MNWNEAVLAALKRLSLRHNRRLVRRSELIAEELRAIVQITGSEGLTPEQTLSRVLQDLRDSNQVIFSARGEYMLADKPIDVAEEELPDEILDETIALGLLEFGEIDTSDEIVLVRRRRGQDRLRAKTLTNYATQCSVCDVRERDLLIASHIVRWADDVLLRGKLTNTICLCTFHDPLFENGYLAFADDLQILRRVGKFSPTVLENLNRASEFRKPVAFLPDVDFLREHRKRTGF